MIVDVLGSEDFVRMLDSLSLSMRDVVFRKARLLVDNPGHPSLNVHPLHQVKERDIWDCYISDSMWMLYEIEEGNLHLWDLGSHAIVDKVHLRRFGSHMHFNPMREFIPENPVTEVASSFEPTFEFTAHVSSWSEANIVPKHGSSNRFTYFQNAHLRILGVPANVVQSLKNASSIEDALALPGLPERTRLWLEEISTSPDLASVMFDSSRTLFPTTLDPLDGSSDVQITPLMLPAHHP